MISRQVKSRIIHLHVAEETHYRLFPGAVPGAGRGKFAMLISCGGSAARPFGEAVVSL